MSAEKNSLWIQISDISPAVNISNLQPVLSILRAGGVLLSLPEKDEDLSPANARVASAKKAQATEIIGNFLNPA